MADVHVTRFSIGDERRGYVISSDTGAVTDLYVEQAAAHLRNMDHEGNRIYIDPAICHGVRRHLIGNFYSSRR